MTEYTTIECDLTGRRARNKNVFEELSVVHASGTWEEPKTRTYHVHLEEILENDDYPETPEFDDEMTRVFIEKYCYEDGEVVGAIATQSRTVGPAGHGSERVFVERDEMTPYHALMASLIEEELEYE